MLYRRFPKIANKEISILAAALPLNCAVEPLIDMGLSALYLPADAKESLSPAFPGTAVILCPEGLFRSREGARDRLAAWLAERGARPRDLAAVHLSSADSGSAETAAKAFGAAAEEAVREGIISGFGFRLEGSPGSAQGIAASGTDWAFWCADYNYVNARDLDPEVRALGGEGIPLVATDPFRGGLLSSVPAEVHQLYFNAPVPRSHEEWALRAIWENQDVVTAVSPPASLAAMNQRLIVAGAGRANSLPRSELEVIRQAGEKLLT